MHSFILAVPLAQQCVNRFSDTYPGGAVLVVAERQELAGAESRNKDRVGAPQ